MIKKKVLTFEKVTISHYKVFDKKLRYICDIKRLRVGQYYHWAMGPTPVVDGKIIYYNIFYTKGQMMEMCEFISQKYSEDIKQLKADRKKEREAKEQSYY